jgi:uncharacterized membrane protein
MGDVSQRTHRPHFIPWPSPVERTECLGSPSQTGTFTGKFKKEKLMKSITLALASALTAVVGLAAADLGQARAADTEKCFGISLAGENEGNVRNDHSHHQGRPADQRQRDAAHPRPAELGQTIAGSLPWNIRANLPKRCNATPGSA